jgi:AbrB family looped-hinge helix DNA binding protein
VKVKISSKGQISIPAGYRKKLNVKKGDQINIIESGDHLLIYPLKKEDLAERESIYKKLAGIWQDMDQNGTAYVQEIRTGSTRDVW